MSKKAERAQPQAPDTNVTSNRQAIIQFENGIKIVQAVLGIIIGFTAVITAFGFVVVNVYLSQFTDIQGYSVQPVQYLVAGVGALPYTIVPAIIFAGIVFVVFKVIAWILPIGIDLAARRVAVPFLKRMAETGNSEGIGTFGVFYTAVIFLLYVILGGPLYGSNLYGMIPRTSLGGQPTPVILIFKDATTPELLGLTVDQNQSQRTESVLFLAELTDGLLVWDTQSGHVVAVQNDTLLGKMDETVFTVANSPIRLPASVPTMTPTPTP